MAVQFQSVQSQYNFASDVSDITITKPTSLAVGDLMVAHIVYQRTIAFTPKTGWYNLAGTVDLATTIDDGSNLKSSVQWKVADSSDVAASNFTWTIDTGRNGGAIFRIIGQNTDPIGASNTAVVNNTTTPSFANTITPPTAESLILMLLTARDATAGSAYAIATDNPTWTERYDLNGSFGYWLGGATATRTEITATGNSSFTPAGAAASSDYTGFMIAIDPRPDPNLSPASINLVSNTPATTVTFSVTANTTPIVITSTLPNATVNTEAPKVTNLDKSTESSVTNLDKS